MASANKLRIPRTPLDRLLTPGPTSARAARDVSPMERRTHGRALYRP